MGAPPSPYHLGAYGSLKVVHAAQQLNSSGCCTLLLHCGQRPRELFAFPAAVPAHRSCAQASDCQDDPDRDYRRSDGLALTTAVSDQSHETGNPGTDPGTGPHRLDPVRLPNLRRRTGIWRAGAQPGVYSLVDLRADPIDQAFCDRTVIVAAKFVMRRCCGSDFVPGHLIHGVTIHLKYGDGLLSGAVSRKPCPVRAGSPSRMTVPSARLRAATFVQNDSGPSSANLSTSWLGTCVNQRVAPR